MPYIAAIAAALIVWGYFTLKIKSLRHLAKEILARAQLEADTLKATALDKFNEHKSAWQAKSEGERSQMLAKLHKIEERLSEREERIEKRMQLLEAKLLETEKRERLLRARRKKNSLVRLQLQQLQKDLTSEWAKIARIDPSEAAEKLQSQLTQALRIESAQKIRETLDKVALESEEKAVRLIATAIQRMALPAASESTITTVALPNDEMKGRIIGKEGRNISALERATGVTFIIDDAPGAVVLSCFDPIRKQIAKIALRELIDDGRIHPTRIEEVVAKSKTLVEKQIPAYGREAALRCNLSGIHPELLYLLGKLKFQSCAGQNMWDHSLEVAHLSATLAAELGLNASLAARIGLLHDIGKAASQQPEESHASIGHDLALKWGESALVANGIGCHHGQMAAQSIEALIVTACNTLSSERPGARLEAVEQYIRRVRKLEEIAQLFPGVEKAWAIQAGRELRLVVLPDLIDDEGILCLTRDIAKKVEQTMTYPGKIKITAIREKRIVEYAL